MVTSFDIETPDLNEEEFWTTLTVTADVTAYGYEELEVRDHRGDLLSYHDLHKNIRVRIDLNLANRVLEERLHAGRILSPMELSDERT